MSRTSQKLINYHTGSKTAQPSVNDVDFGEIVVRHHFESPELLIKVDDTSAGVQRFVNFICASAVTREIQAAIVSSEGETNSVINMLSGSITTFSSSVETNYATKEVASGYAESALSEAKQYADAQDDALSGRVITHIQTAITNALATRLDTDEAAISDLRAFSGLVETTYATKAYADSAATVAKNEVIGTADDTSASTTVAGAKKYTDEKIRVLSGDVVSYVDTKISAADSEISDLKSDVDTLSGSVESMSADMKSYIDEELSVVYKYKGSVANVAALENVENPENGDVYNVVAQNGEPGDSGYTPAGTNYAWVAGDEVTAGHWDALGGVVDLSNYATVDALTTATQDISNLQSRTSDIETAVSALSSSVVTNYATKQYADDAADEAEANAKIASSAYTDSQIDALSGIAKTYVDGLNDTMASRVQTLETTYAISAVTHEEIETAKAVATDSAVTIASGYTKDYVDGRFDTILSGATDSGDTLGKLEDRIKELETGAVGDITSLQSDVHDLKTSAVTWNEKTATALQGAKFGSVASTDSHYSGGSGTGATVDSNAKLKYAEGGDVVIDLSSLIINCGDFE